MAFGKFILAITWGKTIDDSTDEWMVFDTYAQAAKKYAEIIEDDNLYSATIALIVKSTDYVGEGTVIGDVVRLPRVVK
tara:strand:+ start:73 stop:306 length:234 start_codon:yes stop_codon:yes gene_type:complete